MTAAWPVSVKAVVLHEGSVLLGLNHRGEEELPGGRLEAGEQPPETVAREVAEECGLAVRPTRPVHAEVFEVVPGRSVLVVAYRCEPVGPPSAPRASPEHATVRFVPLRELAGRPLPDVYRRAIAAAG